MAGDLRALAAGDEHYGDGHGGKGKEYPCGCDSHHVARASNMMGLFGSSHHPSHFILRGWG